MGLDSVSMDLAHSPLLPALGRKDRASDVAALILRCETRLLQWPLRLLLIILRQLLETSCNIQAHHPHHLAPRIRSRDTRSKRLPILCLLRLANPH